MEEELKKEIEELNNRVGKLEEEINNLRMSHSIPADIYRAFLERFSKDFLRFEQISNVAASDKQQIHETVAFPQVFNGLLKAYDKKGNVLYLSYYTN